MEREVSIYFNKSLVWHVSISCMQCYKTMENKLHSTLAEFVTPHNINGGTALYEMFSVLYSGGRNPYFLLNDKLDFSY